MTDNSINYFVLFLAMVLFSGCTGAPVVQPEPVEYARPVKETCLQDTANSYHVLAPATLDPGVKLPLVVVLDAHGGGSMAVGKFREAVKYFPCIVAGSDQIRNNFPGYEKAMIDMISDIRHKYPVDEKQIVFSGFSGGARMAYNMALKYQVKGLLMMAAGPSQQLPACPLWAISGIGDFNFAEQYKTPNLQSLENGMYTSDYFHGNHEWPSSDQLEDGLLYLYRDLEATIPVRLQREEELLDEADMFSASEDRLLAWKAMEKAYKLTENRKEQEKLQKKARALLDDPAFIETIHRLQQDLQNESRQQQNYSKKLFSEDLEWWKQEINTLNSNLEGEGSGIAKDHFLRLKGFLGILLYSAVNQVIHTDPGSDQLPKLLDIYTCAEPKNPDAWKYKSQYAALTGDKTGSEIYLEKAMEFEQKNR